MLRARVAIATLCFAACASPDSPTISRSTPATADHSDAVVYGADNRQDVYAASDPDLVALAQRTTVALMEARRLDVSDPADVKITAPDLQTSFNLCSDQRFVADPTAAFCTGTLVADDVVLTAGHCIASPDACASARIVFSYLRDAEGAAVRLTSADVFTCSELLAQKHDTKGIDFALIRLDRSAAPRFTPAVFADDFATLAVGESVSVIGCPSGIPFKIDAGGKVRDSRSSVHDFFVANTDTFGGNSGSGVYRTRDHRLLGVLVRGETDYVARGRCKVVNTCAEDACRGEDATYAWNAVLASCVTSSPLIPSACLKP